MSALKRTAARWAEALLLSAFLLFTPQLMGAMCSTEWSELGMQTAPLLEEEVVKHTHDFHVCLDCSGRDEHDLHPPTADWGCPVRMFSRVAVPPPKRG